MQTQLTEVHVAVGVTTGNIQNISKNKPWHPNKPKETSSILFLNLSQIQQKCTQTPDTESRKMHEKLKGEQNKGKKTVQHFWTTIFLHVHRVKKMTKQRVTVPLQMFLNQQMTTCPYAEKWKNVLVTTTSCPLQQHSSLLEILTAK